MINHVWLEKRAQASNTLMTPEETRRQIRELLGAQFSHTGKLFYPDEDFFNMSNDSELQQSAKRLFLWLGVKPGHLEVKFASLPQPGIYTEDPGMKRLIIHEGLSKHPYQCAAVLTHMVMHVLIAGRRRFVIEDPLENEIFTNEAIIQSGLGLVVVNGLASVHPWQRFFIKKPFDPMIYFPSLNQFTKDFAGYISSFRIHHEEYAHYLAPWVEDYLPEELKIRLTVRSAQASFIQQTMDERKAVIARTALAVIIATVLLATGLFLITRGPSGLSDEQKAQLQRITTLKGSYVSCTESLQQKRKELDHNDIFQQQIIDGETARCTSLRNEYNSLVSSYNDSLSD